MRLGTMTLALLFTVLTLDAESQALRGEPAGPSVTAASAPAAGPLAQSSGSAGHGFAYKNVSFKTEYGMTTAIGEMTNASGKSYQIAMFTMSVYDAGGKLLATCPIMIQTFAAGATKSWETYCDGDIPKSLTYKIAFENAM